MELKVYADDQELTTVDALVADQSAGWTADNPLVITYPPRAGAPSRLASRVSACACSAVRSVLSPRTLPSPTSHSPLNHAP
eukprot:2298465-Rhodomonas_salina.1